MSTPEKIFNGIRYVHEFERKLVNDLAEHGDILHKIQGVYDALSINAAILNSKNIGCPKGLLPDLQPALYPPELQKLYNAYDQKNQQMYAAFPFMKPAPRVIPQFVPSGCNITSEDIARIAALREVVIDATAKSHLGIAHNAVIACADAIYTAAYTAR